MKKNTYRVIFFISILLVVLSLAIPVSVESQQQMKNVELGRPFPFLIQELHYDPPSFPRKYPIMSIWENRIKSFSFTVFFANIFIVYFFVLFLIRFITYFINLLTSRLNKLRDQ